MATIEVEVRGPLTQEQYDQLLAHLKIHGEFVAKKERIFVDFTALIPGQPLPDRSLDVRARITNGEPEMVIKVGKWQSNGGRREIAVQLKTGEFTHLVQAFAALGYGTGVVGERKILAYMYKGIEFALVEVPGHSYLFEAEMLVEQEKDQAQAMSTIQSICDELGLALFTDEGFHQYIEKLNKEANKIFEVTKDGEDYFEKKYQI